jgi:hypothetical protein
MYEEKGSIQEQQGDMFPMIQQQQGESNQQRHADRNRQQLAVLRDRLPNSPPPGGSPSWLVTAIGPGDLEVTSSEPLW